MSDLHRRYAARVARRLRAGRNLSCAIAVALIAGACATPGGDGPTVAVLPGGGKSMPEFNTDDIACRDTARATDSSAPTVAMGLGSEPQVIASRGSRLALRDSAESSTGSVFGGAPAAEATAVPTTQQRYDTAYLKCMFSKGHKIPVRDAMSS